MFVEKRGRGYVSERTMKKFERSVCSDISNHFVIVSWIIFVIINDFNTEHWCTNAYTGRWTEKPPGFIMGKSVECKHQWSKWTIIAEVVLIVNFSYFSYQTAISLLALTRYSSVDISPGTSFFLFFANFLIWLSAVD